MSGKVQNDSKASQKHGSAAAVAYPGGLQFAFQTPKARKSQAGTAGKGRRAAGNGRKSKKI